MFVPSFLEIVKEIFNNPKRNRTHLIKKVTKILRNRLCLPCFNKDLFNHVNTMIASVSFVLTG